VCRPVQLARHYGWDTGADGSWAIPYLNIHAYGAQTPPSTHAMPFWRCAAGAAGCTRTRHGPRLNVCNRIRSSQSYLPMKPAEHTHDGASKPQGPLLLVPLQLPTALKGSGCEVHFKVASHNSAASLGPALAGRIGAHPCDVTRTSSTSLLIKDHHPA
jgi:hypothetical protein